MSIEKHGIIASLVLRPHDKSAPHITLLAPIKVQATKRSLVVEAGCDGTVVLLLDNTYSFLNSKTLDYTLGFAAEQ